MSSVASGAVLWLYASGGSFKIVPMTRVTERHFWDCFPKLPVATTDTAKWKAVLKYLDVVAQKKPSPARMPAKALLSLTPLEVMNDTYQTVYKIYLRKLERLLQKVPSRGKEGQRLLSRSCLTR